MTAMPGPRADAAIARQAPSSRPLAQPGPAPEFAWWRYPALVHQSIPSVIFGICAAGVAAGTLSLSINSLDFLRLPLMGLMTLALAGLAAYARRETGHWERGNLLLPVLALAGTVFLIFWPEYLYGHDINGIIHRSLFMSLILLAIGLPAACNALFWVLGGSPSSWDTSRYPLIMYPILVVLFIYGALLWKVASEGFPNLSWGILTTAYDRDITSGTFERTAGMKNYILGTALLITMTAALALPIGIGAGICMSEYPGWVSNVVGFCTQMLRAISVFILGILAFSIADWSEGYNVGTWQSDLFRGFYTSDDGFKIAAHGSFITASLVLSLLVIPVIARSTVEGFRSLPREMREGSVALGATEGHGFLFLLFPWAIPNIITGLLLGCAEAAGSVTVILFIAGSGEFGVGPRNEATSLSYLVYYASRGDTEYLKVMGQYQYTAALMLLFLTFGLSILALVLKQKFGARYRGGISN